MVSGLATVVSGAQACNVDMSRLPFRSRSVIQCSPISIPKASFDWAWAWYVRCARWVPSLALQHGGDGILQRPVIGYTTSRQ